MATLTIHSTPAYATSASTIGRSPSLQKEVTPAKKTKPFELYNKYGAHPDRNDTKTRFCVHAPNAKRVYVVLTHDGNVINKFKMRKIGEAWVLEKEGVRSGHTYCYEIESEHTGKYLDSKNKDDGPQYETITKIKRKIDPFGFRCNRSDKGYESVVCKTDIFPWTDGAWMKERRKNANSPKPINIYEVHARLWKKEGDKALNFEQLAKQLVEHCNKMQFTHVELFGLLEHPYEGSLGYHPLSLFAPNSRLFDSSKTPWESIVELQSFVNKLHENNIGVILDFVPDHFANDDIGLKEFDGSALFERANRCKAFGTFQFDFSKKFVRDYLISAAHFWVKVCHIDGLRIDAVQEILYSPNGKGSYLTDQTDGAGTYLRRQNRIIHTQFPGVLMIAEKSGDISKMTAPIEEEGYEFDLTWGFGIAADTVGFFTSKPAECRAKYGMLEKIDTDPLSRKAFQVFSASHDMVNIEKGGSFFTQFGGTESDFIKMRLFHVFTAALPVAKLQIMGSELATKKDWLSGLEKEGVNWKELDDPKHKEVLELCASVNKLYKDTSDFWANRFEGSNFKWLAKHTENYVMSFWRGENYACIFNFGSIGYPEYDLPLDQTKRITSLQEVINSRGPFDGSSLATPVDIEGAKRAIRTKMPPFSGRIFKVLYQ